LFPIGQENTAYNNYFIGQSYLAPIANEGFPIFNVTFEPGCRNHWHTHTAEKGGGQMIICVGGIGYYQEFGRKAIKLLPGDTVTIPANVKHWHGASQDSWFSHLAFEIPGEKTNTEWHEAVSPCGFQGCNGLQAPPTISPSAAQDAHQPRNLNAPCLRQ